MIDRSILGPVDVLYGYRDPSQMILLTSETYHYQQTTNETTRPFIFISSCAVGTLIFSIVTMSAAGRSNNNSSCQDEMDLRFHFLRLLSISIELEYILIGNNTMNLIGG